MENMTYLFLAYAAIWTGLFVFILQISKHLSGLQKQVESLQQDMQSKHE